MPDNTPARDEALYVLQERITYKLAQIGRYFLRNYDSTLHDGQMQELVSDLDQLESLKERLS
jgi:hypothetical protein